MMENLKEKIENFLKDILKKINDNPENKEKYYNELKKFIIEIGCELFNKTKKDYGDLPLNEYVTFLYESDLSKKDRKLAANYLALCILLAILNQNTKQ